MRSAEGGPFATEGKLSPEVQLALERRFGLDQPLHWQYFGYLKGLLQGDLGPSMRHKDKSVNEMIADTLPHSLLLGALALGLALWFGILAGTVSALWRGRPPDSLVMIFAVVGLCLPPFVIGPLFQLLFAMKLKWLPVAGYAGLSDLSYLVLPAFTLSLPFIARIARLTRAGMLDTLSRDYILLARSHGFSTTRIVLRHALRPSLIPVLAYLGPATAHLLTGSLVVEKVFQLPGLGREFVEGALARDYTMVMGTVLVYGSLLILFNLLGDLLHSWADPKVETT